MLHCRENNDGDTGESNIANCLVYQLYDPFHVERQIDVQFASRQIIVLCISTVKYTRSLMDNWCV